MNRAAFLDRDGTLIEHVAYLSDPARVRLAPGAPEALQRLRQAGFLLVIISNQSLVSRGLGTRLQADAVSRRMEQLFAEEGVRFDSIKYCFHAADSNSPRRKPNPGMLLEAAAELDIDLKRSAMVGDDLRDPQAGRAAGCALNLLIAPGPVEGETTVPTISAAAQKIIESI